MKKKPFKSILALLLAIIALGACSNGSGESPAAASSASQSPASGSQAPASNENPSSAPDRVTLEFLAPSPVSQVNDWDVMLEELYRRTDDILNIRINYVFTTFDDIGQKISLKMSAGEQLDGAFVAQWTTPSMQQMISQGLLTNLDGYFNNDAYPGLKQYFSKEYVETNSFTDANNESHLYAIPFTNNYFDPWTIYYRKDLASKYGLGEIGSYDSLIEYMDAVKLNEPGMVPMSYLGSTDLASMQLLEVYRDIPKTSGHNEQVITGTGGVSIAIRDDGTAYASRHFVPGLDPEFYKLLKPPYNNEDPLLGFKLAREWYEKGYFEKDILSQKDHEGQFVAGKAAAYFRGVSTYTDTETRLTSSVPGAEMGVFILSGPIRFNTPKTQGVDFQAWNFLAIPTTSKYVDRVMAFMNWMYEDRSNHDLIEYGVEGKHWIKVGDDKYDIPEGVDPSANYNFYGYVLSWNPQLMRYSVNTPDFILDALKKMGDPEELYRNPASGFSFVSDSLLTEMAKINDLAAYNRALSNGVVADIEAEVERVQALYEEAGFLNVAEEVERQFNEYLKDHPYNGQ
ncbi:MAG: ABC transporter substrate-binding protein [Clostridiales bacterium]|jgi:putative aldouronate transport system substrate-binding protein|nr:ABC transporter substrate-binding protein [Clostridiales bacterium]